MTLDEALEIVVARTRHERYRWHCSDDNPNARGREAYRRSVLSLAGAPEPEPPPPPEPVRPHRRVPLADSIRAVRFGLRNCLYATREGCGCSGAMCHHFGRVVTLTDCLACLPPSRKEDS